MPLTLHGHEGGSAADPGRWDLRNAPLALHSLVPCLAALVLLASSGGAQIITRQNPTPWHNQIGGGPGPDVLVGTSGPDWITDVSTGDTDVMIASPGGPDGEWDTLNGRDGDNLDNLYGGPEDHFYGDALDTVIIVAGPGTVLWTGSYQEYVRVRALVRWLRDRLQRLLAMLETTQAPPGFWPAAFAQVSAELAAIGPPPDSEELVLYPDYFDLGPYAFGTLPPSPGNFLAWLPYAPDTGPAQATSQLVMTAAELDAAAADAQTLLQYALAAGGE